MLDRTSLDAELRALDSEGLAVSKKIVGFRSIALRYFLPPYMPSPLRCPTGDEVEFGSRFAVSRHLHKCLYAALDAETAHREGNQLFYTNLARGVRSVKTPVEVVIIGVRFNLKRMLDLRDPGIQRRLGTTSEELAGKWYTVPDAPTQRLGDAAHACGAFEGLIYRSVRNPGGTCLVAFPDRLADGSFIEFQSRTPGVPRARLGRGGSA